MCNDAMIFRRSGKHQCVSNRGQLAKALGLRWNKLPNRRYEGEGADWSPSDAPNHCLCHVDMEALGRMTGMAVEPPDYGDTDHFDAWALREGAGE